MALAAAPAVRALLGCEPHQARAEHLHHLIDDRVRESDWLDYKGQVPQDVAKSVAALANAGGGVLIFGLDEDQATHAPILVGCDAAAVTEQVQQQVATAVSPHPRYEATAGGDHSGVGRGGLSDGHRLSG